MIPFWTIFRRFLYIFLCNYFVRFILIYLQDLVVTGVHFVSYTGKQTSSWIIFGWFFGRFFERFFSKIIYDFFTSFEKIFGQFFCKIYSFLPARLGSDWGTFCFVHWWTNFILNYFTFLQINSCAHCLWNLLNNVGTLLHSFWFRTNLWWGGFTNLFLKKQYFKDYFLIKYLVMEININFIKYTGFKVFSLWLKITAPKLLKLQPFFFLKICCI